MKNFADMLCVTLFIIFFFLPLDLQALLGAGFVGWFGSQSMCCIFRSILNKKEEKNDK